MTAKPSCVYVLSDPRTKSVRFVGCSRKSPKQLVAFVPFMARGPSGAWRKELHDNFLAPALTILEWVNEETWQDRLAHWTKVYAESGADLLQNKYADPAFVPSSRPDARVSALEARVRELEAKCIASGVQL